MREKSITVGRNEYMIIAHYFGSCPTVMTGGFNFNWKSISNPSLEEKEVCGP